MGLNLFQILQINLSKSIFMFLFSHKLTQEDPRKYFKTSVKKEKSVDVYVLLLASFIDLDSEL